MKDLVKKHWFLKTIILSLLLIVFFLTIGILSMGFGNSFVGYTPWSIIKHISTDMGIGIYSIVLLAFLFGSIIPLIAASISTLRKKKNGFYACAIYFLILEIGILVYHFVFNCLKTGAIVLMIINFILVFASFALIVWMNVIFKNEVEEETSEQINAKTKSPILGVLIIDIISLIALVTMFVLPVYSYQYGEDSHICILISNLFDTSKSILDSVSFAGVFALFVFSAIYFSTLLPYMFTNKKKFVIKSTNLININLMISIAFFILGFFIKFYYDLSGYKCESISFIPMIIMAVITIISSILQGKCNTEMGIVTKELEHKYPKIEPLIYVAIVTAVTFLAMFLNVIKVTFDSSSYNSSLTLTGYKLVSDYPNLGAGYQVLAFVIVAMMISSGVGLILSISSYFAKYKHFNRVAAITVYMNFAFVFAIGISGFYFSIAQEINKENLDKLIAYYNISGVNSSSYKYKISTDVIYALGVDVVLLIIMFFRKVLNRIDEENELKAIQAVDDGNNNSSSSLGGSMNDEISKKGFDACPAFSEIDLKVPAFQADIINRKKRIVKEPSLPSLVKFIVDYARNSRLHLSYTQEDIATFISGLGACRLSILQGMSGTGKTSLPKIFAEAIDGECDIIEVESSWKDKNELLGFYNEFSKKYSPKKFTLALYQAALNKEIPTFIVLDEMNLSRIEYYFSDFLSLMENEPDKRKIKLVNVQIAHQEDGKNIQYSALCDGHTLKIPENVWFIGTANRDESTFVISDKVYDRAHTMNFNKRAPKVREYGEPIEKQFYTYKQIEDLLEDAISKGTFDAENNETIKKVEELLAPFNISFGNRILKQIEEFVSIYQQCFEGKNVLNQAVETILLSKVVSKLEVKIVENKSKLAKAFEELNLLKCAEFVNKLNED